MTLFGNGQAAYLLLLVLPLLFISYRGYKKGRKAAEAFARKDLLEELAPPRDTKRRIAKSIFLLGGLVFSLLALMRPLGGLQAESIKQSGLNIIIAMDVSRSMLAEDVKPNRLESSRSAARNFLQTLRGDRIGLVAFAGSAFLLCPLTSDYAMAGGILDGMDMNTIPRGGTSLAKAIVESVKGFQGTQEGSRVLLIITDGEDQEGAMLREAEAARETGVRIFTLGVGTAAGELIPLTTEGGRGGFLKDRQGKVVKSRLDEAALRDVALHAGGDYLRLGEAGPGLQRLRDEKFATLERQEMGTGTNRQRQEWFQLPLGLALLLMTIEPFLSHRKKD